MEHGGSKDRSRLSPGSQPYLQLLQLWATALKMARRNQEHSISDSARKQHVQTSDPCEQWSSHARGSCSIRKRPALQIPLFLHRPRVDNSPGLSCPWVAASKVGVPLSGCTVRRCPSIWGGPFTKSHRRSASQLHP